MGDNWHKLRKLPFPQCASEALQVVSQIIMAFNPGRKSMDLASDIVTEFVFCEKTQNKQLNCLQELQLLDLICKYFERNCSTPAHRATLFTCVFPIGDERRTPFLVKLVSMAVAIKSTKVLSAAGVWLQQVGFHTCSGLTLAKSISKDYLALVPDAFEQLQDLPHIAPEFAANLLAAFTETYSSTEKGLAPPTSLLKVVAFWASKSQGLCTTALTLSRPPTMPFIGLVRWCITAPLLGCVAPESYSQLHLALLESIVISPRESLVTSSCLTGLVTTILQLLPDSHPNEAQQSINRFTQIAIVLLKTGKVNGSLGDLCLQISKLPQNEMLEHFHNCHKFLISPPFYRMRT